MSNTFIGIWNDFLSDIRRVSPNNILLYQNPPPPPPKKKTAWEKYSEGQKLTFNY